MSVLLDELRKAAVEFAKAGGDVTLDYFQKSFELKYKEDASPVTNADRESEKLIREKIRDRYPDHGIIGEEFGREKEDADIVWILDPIDGTKSFIHGVPFYTTLIGVMVKGVPSAGVIYAPATGEMTEASLGSGCRLNGKPVTVRKCTNLAEATFLTTDVTSFSEYGYEKPLQKMIDSTRLHRTWGDAYGHMLVATGRADVMIDAVLHLWDAAALLPIITEAGGVYTDLRGKPLIETGNGISSAPGIHRQIIQLFNSED